MCHVAEKPRQTEADGSRGETPGWHQNSPDGDVSSHRRKNLLELLNPLRANRNEDIN